MPPRTTANTAVSRLVASLYDHLCSVCRRRAFERLLHLNIACRTRIRHTRGTSRGTSRAVTPSQGVLLKSWHKVWKKKTRATELVREWPEYINIIEYRGCYALPLLRTNARILRLPFEL